MERLTYVTENGEILFHPEDLPEDEGMTIRQLAEDERWKALDQIAEKLTNMEQMEEHGILVRLPCKVGDTDVEELMEKQIPKIINMNDEIKYLDGESVGWVCPTCNVIIFDFGIYDYCPHCGQKLEWRDGNIEAESN